MQLPTRLQSVYLEESRFFLDQESGTSEMGKASKLILEVLITTFLCAGLSEGVYYKKPDCGPIVRTRQGPVEGVTKTLFNGKQVDSYLGIPYAAPPTGQLRFAPPHPITHWNGTIQAKTKPCSCFQAASEMMKHDSWFVSSAPELEDCLYLNIWVPKTAVPMQKLAVIVWIHGVSGMTGSSNMDIYDGSVLASEENVIVVTMNYRLSLFGFLYLNLPDAPGNVGILDQLEALRWVQDNIAMFRGDPSRVTLFGESFVGFHLLSPHSWELFNQAIMVGGPPNVDEASISKEDAMSHAQELSRAVGCSLCANSPSAVLDCLRQKSAAELMAPFRELPRYLRSPFAPVQNDLEVPMNADAAVTHVPPRYRKNCIVGSTSEDSALFLTAFFPEKVMSDHTRISEEDLVRMMSSRYNSHDDRSIRQSLYQYKQRDNQYNPSQVRKEVVRLLSDTLVTCGTNDFAENYAGSSNKVFQYYFTHRPSRAVKKATPAWTGSVRGDDLAFVFGVPLNPKEGYSQKEVALSRLIMGYWSNFAKTGNPNRGTSGRKDNYFMTPFGQPNSRPQWPEYNPNEKKYLHIHTNAGEKSRLRDRQCTYWKGAFPELLASYKDHYHHHQLQHHDHHHDHHDHHDHYPADYKHQRGDRGGWDR